MSESIDIEFSITAWSKSLGIHHATLENKLVKAGFPRSGAVTARQVFDALHGEKEASVIEFNRERSAKLAQERQVRAGELVEIPQAERMLWLELLFPLRQEIELMPEKLAPLLTGDESERVAGLRDWWEETKRKLWKE